MTHSEWHARYGVEIVIVRQMYDDDNGGSCQIEFSDGTLLWVLPETLENI